MTAPVRLYLVRHARAERRGPRWPDDRRRPLTGAGIAAFDALLRSARMRAVRLDLVLTSGFRRASGTARLLVRASRHAAPVRVTRVLEPGRDPAGVLRALKRIPGGRVALVGHEPDLSMLLTLLTGKTAPPLRKGAICCVYMARIEARAGRVVWMAAPGGTQRRAGVSRADGAAGSGRRAAR